MARVGWQRVKPILVQALGYGFLVLGVLGMFLPILQGFLFIFVGLIVLSRSIVGVLFQGGEFTAHDTEQTAIALSYYSIGLAAYAAIKVVF